MKLSSVRLRRHQYGGSALLLTFQPHSAQASVTADVVLSLALVLADVCSLHAQDVHAGVVILGCNLVLFTSADLSPVFVPGDIKGRRPGNFTFETNLSPFERVHWRGLPAENGGLYKGKKAVGIRLAPSANKHPETVPAAKRAGKPVGFSVPLSVLEMVEQDNAGVHSEAAQRDQPRSRLRVTPICTSSSAKP